jgi:hypothetical protein
MRSGSLCPLLGSALDRNKTYSSPLIDLSGDQVVRIYPRLNGAVSFGTWRYFALSVVVRSAAMRQPAAVLWHTTSTRNLRRLGPGDDEPMTSTRGK